MPRKRPTYRQTALLCGLVLTGWVWDLALGGGRAHSWAWLAALVLVGGISGLTVWSAQRYLVVAEPSPQPAPEPDLQLRPANPEDLAEAIEVAAAANRLFELSDLTVRPDPPTIDALRAAALVVVAGKPVAGFIQLGRYDGELVIEQLAVRPSFLRRGIGTALVVAAAHWAADGGYRSLMVRAFPDAFWNESFFTAAGFLTTSVGAGRADMRLVFDSQPR